MGLGDFLLERKVKVNVALIVIILLLMIFDLTLGPCSGDYYKLGPIITFIIGLAIYSFVKL